MKHLFLLLLIGILKGAMSQVVAQSPPKISLELVKNMPQEGFFVYRPIGLDGSSVLVAVAFRDKKGKPTDVGILKLRYEGGIYFSEGITKLGIDCDNWGSSTQLSNAEFFGDYILLLFYHIDASMVKDNMGNSVIAESSEKEYSKIIVNKKTGQIMSRSEFISYGSRAMSSGSENRQFASMLHRTKSLERVLEVYSSESLSPTKISVNIVVKRDRIGYPRLATNNDGYTYLFSVQKENKKFYLGCSAYEKSGKSVFQYKSDAYDYPAIRNLKVVFDQESNLHICASLSLDGARKIDWTYLVLNGKTGNEIRKTLIQLDKNSPKQFGYKTLRKYGGILPNFIHPVKNGTIITGQFFYRSTVKDYGDIYILKLDKQAKIEWIRTIPMHQFSRRKWRNHHYSFLGNENGVALLYNEQEDNLLVNGRNKSKTSMLPASSFIATLTFSKARTYPTVSYIDLKGNQSQVFFKGGSLPDEMYSFPINSVQINGKVLSIYLTGYDYLEKPGTMGILKLE